MLQNFFKIAWRNIAKNRLYSVVNIIGLSAGLTFALLMGAYVWSEWQVNSQLKNADRQYIIQSKWREPNQGYEISTVGPLAKALRERYPGLVANYFRFDGIFSIVSNGSNSFREDIAIGDSTILTMYGFRLLHGDAATALNEPFSLVISADEAIKYFGRTDVVGKAVSIQSFSGSKHDFTITGIIENPPKNSVTRLNEDNDNQIYISAANIAFFGRNMDWPNPHIVSYIELQKGVSPAAVLQPMEHLIRQNVPAQIASNMTPFLVPLKSYHLDANNGLVRKMLYALTSIALFILLMAIVNFINMSVSRSAARMREIGVRKVLGGRRRQLVIQFLVESVIIVFFAMVCALVFYVVCRPVFSEIVGTQIPSLAEFPVSFLLWPVVLVLGIGFIAGIYPALVLSSLQPVASLKGTLSSVKDNVLLRKSLVAFQFGTATIALVGAIIISKQVSLFLSKDLGYDKNLVVSSQVPRNWTRAGVDQMEAIRRQLRQVKGVTGATLSYEIPDGNNGGQAAIYKFGSDSSQAVASQALVSDENYLGVYQIPLHAGSFFAGNGSDSAKVILNDTAIKALGFSNAADAVGQPIRIPGDPTIFHVLGVTNDFHFGSMQAPIEPDIFFNVQFATQFRFLSFKIQSGDIPGTIAALQQKWSSLMPGAPFEYKFMDDTLAQVYKSELQLKKAAFTATILALIIVLLGVMGLISLSVQKRTKEIGVRKVLGSSVAGIMGLFVKEFLWVIALGGVVACPVAYLIMSRWLQGYAYRINVTPIPFVFSMGALGILTIALIGFQTIKAALANPVDSLRTE